MNFLNEVSERFPQAISFASGRPADDFFEMDQWLGETGQFVRHFGAVNNLSDERARKLIAQYGRTAGIIGDLISAQLRNDEHIDCGSGQILVTAGCQEAIELLLRSLCTDVNDVILVRSPSYIGITGAADLASIDVVPIFCDDDEHLGAELASTIATLESRGKRARALYLVPDFDNPTGKVLSARVRTDIIEVCAKHSVAILEDNPYGMFRYAGDRVPSMFELDRHGCVVFLGTYSKTVCPALRVGFIVVPAFFRPHAVTGGDFIHLMSQRKSFGTLNTSQISQAIIGGILLRENLSLRRFVSPALKLYRENRDRMLAALESQLGQYAGRISWNRPDGGFFLTLSLPFEFLAADVEQCARQCGVLVMPLSFFALGDDNKSVIRLAFSNVAPEMIEVGIGRLGRFLGSRMAV